MEIKINKNKNDKFNFLQIISAFHNILKKYTLTEVEELMEIYDSGGDVVFIIDEITLAEIIKKDLFRMGVKFYLINGESETYFEPTKSELWDFIQTYEKSKKGKK